MSGSWKTTLFGTVAAAFVAIAALCPNDTVKKVAGILSAAGIGLVGVVARDNDKSSEDVGAK